MIRYALRCQPHDHRWDAWFPSGADYEVQVARELVSCPACGATEVEKAPMAPAVLKGRSDQAITAVATPPADTHPELTLPEPVRAFFQGWREHMARHSEDVGDTFAREARAMHEGESDPRPIHGEATQAEARALIEDGVPVAPLPALAHPKAFKGLN
jgi:hypothetical protein